MLKALVSDKPLLVLGCGHLREPILVSDQLQRRPPFLNSGGGAVAYENFDWPKKNITACVSQAIETKRT